MNIEKFAERVMELFPQILKGFVQYENNYLTRGKITLPQFWALDYLCRNAKCKMNNLAKHLRISPPATTGLIDRLIAQNLVTRRDDQRDRRIIWIELTSQGKGIINSIRKQKIMALIKVFGKISPQDRDYYLNILEQVARNTSSSPLEEFKRKNK